jgi:transcriptional regulator with XRE-family HTH domain
MNNSLEDLRENFRDLEYREAYAEDFLNTYVATQIQVLREQRGLSQQELAELIGSKQPGVSRLENVNHTSWKTHTLKKIASALGVRLRISFETYGDLLFEVDAFGRRFLQRPTFEKDPAFNTFIETFSLSVGMESTENSAGEPAALSTATDGTLVQVTDEVPAKPKLDAQEVESQTPLAA